MEAVGIAISYQKNRNTLSTFANISLPFGIYTALAYRSTDALLFILVSLLAVVLSVIFLKPVINKLIGAKRKAEKVYSAYIRQIVIKVQLIFSIVLSCAMVIIVIGPLDGSSTLHSVAGARLEEATIANNMETILLLQESSWTKLNTDQKLDVMQTAADIECRYLGIPYPLEVKAASLKEKTLGRYINATHIIEFDYSNLAQCSAAEALHILCHEAYQHCQAALFQAAPSEYKNLKLLRRGRTYLQEFRDYDSGDGDDLNHYYQQQCEADARAYSEEAVMDYYQRIYRYLAESEESTKDQTVSS